jgi:hydrogenase-4 component B
MNRLGGLIHRLPRSAVIAFTGTLGIAALPPLNGFVSEWLIFQACSRDSAPAVTRPPSSSC